MIETLIGMPFNPMRIAEFEGAERVYNIIPLGDQDRDKRKKLKKAEQIDFDINQLNIYPEKYAGTLSSKVFKSAFRDNQTMFNFVNVFTEYAHQEERTIERQIEIEKKTGDFVNWVIDNKKKLS